MTEKPKDSLNVPIDLNRKRRSLQDGNLPKFRPDSHYMTHTAGTGAQGIGLLHGRQGLSKPEEDLIRLYQSGDHLFSEGNRQEILEETSLADFLRVLTALHNRVGERIIAEDFKPKRKLGTASLTPPRIASLINLFPDPEPSPKSPTKRKFSLMPNIFSQSSSRRGSLRPSPSPEDPGPSSDKAPESSNLKRLGRFLLRSYSLTPKTDSNPDVSLIHRDSYRFKNRKRPSLKPGEPSNISTYPSQEAVHCPIIIQIDSPTNSLKRSEDTGIVRSNTMDPSVSNRLSSFRRGSTPVSVIDTNPFFRDRFRSASSSESVFTLSPTSSRRFPDARQSPRWRPVAKPGLSDVKEVTK